MVSRHYPQNFKFNLLQISHVCLLGERPEMIRCSSPGPNIWSHGWLKIGPIGDLPTLTETVLFKYFQTLLVCLSVIGWVFRNVLHFRPCGHIFGLLLSDNQSIRLKGCCFLLLPEQSVDIVPSLMHYFTGSGAATWCDCPIVLEATLKNFDRWLTKSYTITITNKTIQIVCLSHGM